MTEVTWYGHSAFQISCDGKSLLIDPFFTPQSQFSLEKAGSIDVVLVTHDHADHVGDTVSLCQKTGAMLGTIVGTAQRLEQAGIPSTQILNGIGFNMGGTVEFAGFAITMVPAYHSSESGAPTGFIIRTHNGKYIYHAGDTCLFSEMELWGKLYPIELALLPMGGVFTMDARQAAEACRLLQCKAVLPMHWGTFPVLAQDTNEFCHELLDRAPQCQCLSLEQGATLTL